MDIPNPVKLVLQGFCNDHSNYYCLCVLPCGYGSFVRVIIFWETLKEEAWSSLFQDLIYNRSFRTVGRTLILAAVVASELPISIFF